MEKVYSYFSKFEEHFKLFLKYVNLLGYNYEYLGQE